LEPGLSPSAVKDREETKVRRAEVFDSLIAVVHSTAAETNASRFVKLEGGRLGRVTSDSCGVQSDCEIEDGSPR
jgi:hypothetical protein